MKQLSSFQLVIATLLAMTILHVTNSSAKMYGGKIVLEIGETYSVSAVPTSGYTASGSFSKSGTNFTITAQSSYSCTISANYAGSGTLSYWGVVAPSNSWTTQTYDIYWDVVVKAPTVYVTGVTLSNSSLSLGVGDSKQLSATVLPNNATNKNVTWSSSDTGVATVSSNGLVTAQTVGTANITCKANDGSGKNATCTVKVTEPIKVTGISLNYTTAKLGKDETLQLVATVSPADASNKEVSWASSDDKIATVSDDGLVRAVAYGSASITCTAKDGSGKQATCTVTVPEPIKVTGISLNHTTAKLSKDETLQLVATVSPADAANNSVSWTSSDDKIATVSDDGLVKAVAYGSASITCTAEDGSGINSTCAITVEKPDNWINSGNYTISWFNKNKTEFTISTAKELAGMAYIANNGYTDFHGKTITLAADIDLSGKNWTPCNVFRGTFDGAGHTISGIDINWEQSVTKSRDTIFVGFWKKIYDAEIKNVNLKGKYKVHCINDYSTSYSDISIGGMAGEMYKTIIEKCVSDVNIKLSCKENYRNSNWYEFGRCCLGGLIGRQQSNTYLSTSTTIRYCKYTGQLSITGEDAPDLSYYGGIIGSDYSMDIEYCENLPSAPFVYDADEHEQIYIGGITGSGGSDTNILCCRNVMDSIVIGKHGSIYIGGIAASRSANYEDRVKNCYSQIGEIHVKEKDDSYKLYYGGIISRSSDFNSNGPTACFSNNDVVIEDGITVNRVHDGSTSFSSEQMKTSAFLEELNMYSTFEMDGPVWTQPAEGGYPYIAQLYESTGLKTINVEKTSDNVPVYSLSGQRLAAPRKGVNIVGGRKVVVK